MELKGSKTEQNLMTAFAGESQARNKYTYFASKAKKDGYEQIAAIFEETANNEKEHAKMWFKELNGGEIGTTAENLLAAEYIPFCAIPITADIIVLSDALTIHQEIILGINGTEYFIISFKVVLSYCFGFIYL